MVADDRIQTKPAAHERRRNGKNHADRLRASLSATDLVLGDYAGGGGVAFEGAIDEPKIWARTLCPAEIADDMRFELKGFFSPVDNSPLVNAAKVGSGLSYVGERSLRRLWKTKKAWAGSCRRVVVQLADGQLPTASVRFVK